MSTTLTGPRSFKATLNRREKTERYAPHEVIVEAATFTFDASSAASKSEQRALFSDYAKTAKELGHKLPAAQRHPQRIQYADGGEWIDAPKFTAPAFTPSERKFLGKTVGFRPRGASHFSPVAGGVSDSFAGMLHGTVWARSPYGPAFWVYVEGRGFYSVREADLLTGVNA